MISSLSIYRRFAAVVVSSLALGILTHNVSSQAAQDGPDLANCSLHGTYVYRNVTADVASFGTVTLDGAGSIRFDLRINTADANGTSGRQTITTIGTGTYLVEPSGIGVADVTFSGIPLPERTYDFVIAQTNDGYAERVFSVVREGGVNDQLVFAEWVLRSAPANAGC